MQPAPSIGSQRGNILRQGTGRPAPVAALPPRPEPAATVPITAPIRHWSLIVTYSTSFLILLVLLIPSSRRNGDSEPLEFDEFVVVEQDAKPAVQEVLEHTQLRLDHLQQIESQLDRIMAVGKKNNHAAPAASYRTVTSPRTTTLPGQTRKVIFSSNDRVAKPEDPPIILPKRVKPVRAVAPIPSKLAADPNLAEPQMLVRGDELQQVVRVITRHSRRRGDAVRLASLITHESRRSTIDPLFVAAVIKTESAFNPTARSHKGATGLMQIMPGTSAFIRGFDQFKNEPRGLLTDETYNIRQGVAYLKYLLERYRGNQLLALMAYNWGPGHVEKAMKGKFGVPPEVLKYATRILDDNKRWRNGVGMDIATS